MTKNIRHFLIYIQPQATCGCGMKWKERRKAICKNEDDVQSQLRAMLLSPSPHSFTTLLTRSSNFSRPRIVALHKTLSFHSYTSFRFPTSLNFPASFAFVVPVQCLSSIFLANTLEWNEPVLCSEIGDADSEGRSLGEEDSRTSILVRAPKTKRKKI